MRLRLLPPVVLLALALAPGPAFAAEKAIWGPLDLPDGRSAFPTYRGLGVDTFQIDLNWAQTAPTRPARPRDPNDPAYRWPAAVDRAVREASANEVGVALLVALSPPWANGGRSPIRAPSIAAYADFLVATSRRYPTIRKWMIWGEPNRSDRFLPNAPDSPAGPRAYALLLDAAYRGLKRESRRNVVIGGMTWTGGDVTPARFLRLMRLPSGRRPRLDWFGHNPYPFRFPDLRALPLAGGFRDISDLDTFSRELRKAYGRRARFWLSEFTIQSDRGSRQFDSYVSRAQQARWLAAAFGIADRLDSVAGLGWYRYADETPAQLSANWGLVTASGRHKPALRAFRRAPSMRFRPRVAVRRSTRRALVRRSGFRVRVVPRARGRVVVELRTPGGRRVARASRRVRAGRGVVLRLRSRRPARCRCTLRVRATRGSTLRRSVLVR